ncbi:hypothetical protein ACMD2_18085, partial [Ananas comosus]
AIASSPSQEERRSSLRAPFALVFLLYLLSRVSLRLQGVEKISQIWLWNRDLNSIMSELTYDQVFDDMPTLHNSSNFDQNIFFDPSTFSTDPSPFLNTPNINVSSSSSFSSSSSTAAPAAEAEFSDDSEMSSDILFTYINRILMEEDIDTKFDQYRITQPF